MYTIKEYTLSDGRKVIKFLTTYAGRRVVGKATCSSADSFNYAFGCHLAKSRCDSKVATKRRKNAERKYNEAVHEFLRAKKQVDKMLSYLNDSVEEEQRAIEQVSKLEER